VAPVVSIDDFQHERVKATVHQQSLVLDKKFMPENTLGNVVYLLRYDAAWKGRLFYNQFADRIEIKGRPDWRREQLNKSEGITTYDFAFMQSWFSSVQSIRLEVSRDKLESACFAAATPYHPVKDYLDPLVWDGIPRLDRFLPDTTRCVDNAYTRAAGACFLKASVKRIYEPGCKQDYLLVLESTQGKRKSMWVEKLGDPWSSTGELVRGDKDTYQNLRGKWIVELPEIDHTFNKQDVSWLKKTITTSSDTYRPSYARVAESVPRESVFIATINPSGSGAYLKDEENRRYWPIKTGELDVETLIANRDQYFAEAKHRYLAGEKTWIDDPEALAIAKKEQELRRERDPWADLLKNWVNAQKGKFSSAEVFLAMGIPAKDINSRHRDRLYSALRELGWDFNREVGGGTWSKVLKWEDLI
jgi:predicted P-loop ATPase